MILLAAVLVAVAAAMVLLGVSLGGLVWLYGAIVAATVALGVLAIGVVRELRDRRTADGDGTSVSGEDGDDADPDRRAP